MTQIEYAKIKYAYAYINFKEFGYVYILILRNLDIYI